MSRVIDRERPLWAMYEWQLRNAVTSNLDSMKAVDPGSSRAFTWGTGWFAYEATNPLTDTYQALRNFGIAQKGDIWVGPMDSTGDQPGQIRYRSFATDRYDFDFPYVDEIVIARAGLANPLMFTVRQTSLSTRRA